MSTGRFPECQAFFDGLPVDIRRQIVTFRHQHRDAYARILVSWEQRSMAPSFAPELTFRPADDDRLEDQIRDWAGQAWSWRRFYAPPIRRVLLWRRREVLKILNLLNGREEDHALPTGPFREEYMLNFLYFTDDNEFMVAGPAASFQRRLYRLDYPCV